MKFLVQLRELLDSQVGGEGRLILFAAIQSLDTWSAMISQRLPSQPADPSCLQEKYHQMGHHTNRHKLPALLQLKHQLKSTGDSVTESKCSCSNLSRSCDTVCDVSLKRTEVKGGSGGSTAQNVAVMEWRSNNKNKVRGFQTSMDWHNIFFVILMIDTIGSSTGNQCCYHQM